jgi:hypothetical protein
MGGLSRKMSLAYSKIYGPEGRMDERKKTIRELEDKKREVQASINGILETLGADLLVRLDKENGSHFTEDLEEYRRIIKEIADSEEYIKEIEADTLRLRELEEDIIRKEKIYSEKNKDLSALYARLGEILLEEPEFSSFAGSFKGQLEVLITKIRSLEDRLTELEEGKNANIFAWIGKNTQGMVIRSMLVKSQGGLQRIYAAAGEKFASQNDREAYKTNSDVQTIMEQVLRLGEDLEDLGKALTLQRTERRKIGEAFAAEGSPAKKNHGLERHIVHAKEQLNALYLRFGVRIADGREGGGESLEIESYLTDSGDPMALDRVGTFREEMAEYDASIDKLKASLAIDAVREEIEKMEKTITGHKQRIAASEEAIAGLENQIEESNRRIQELMKI